MLTYVVLATGSLRKELFYIMSTITPLRIDLQFRNILYPYACVCYRACSLFECSIHVLVAWKSDVDHRAWGTPRPDLIRTSQDSYDENKCKRAYI